ncbi:MAG: hypothetical protein LPL29_14545 [Alphaproteobacteria bacterium]|nr:hypothetical protein [Alphaproteobacteria bacterium]
MIQWSRKHAHLIPNIDSLFSIKGVVVRRNRFLGDELADLYTYTLTTPEFPGREFNATIAYLLDQGEWHDDTIAVVAPVPVGIKPYIAVFLLNQDAPEDAEEILDEDDT